VWLIDCYSAQILWFLVISKLLKKIQEIPKSALKLLKSPAYSHKEYANIFDCSDNCDKDNDE